MCRGKKSCSELGTDPSKWSKESPLPPPKWFENELALFQKAIHEASLGNKAISISILKTVRDSDLRNWYVEHGQVSGNFRNKILRFPKPKYTNVILDKTRSPNKYVKDVFQRDNYTCRYCGLKVIPKEVLATYSKVVGNSIFQDTGTNIERHGVVMAFRANADHVVPWKLGGQTNLHNLVTCCWSCNYGKAGYTLGQIGLTDPRNRKILAHDWDGLASVQYNLKNFVAN